MNDRTFVSFDKAFTFYALGSILISEHGHVYLALFLSRYGGCQVAGGIMFERVA